MNKTVKLVLKIVICVLLAVIVLAAGYLGYYTIGYKRIGDKTLEVETGKSNAGLYTNTTYSLLSWNIGFGAYSDDYSFFMDGGKYGRAFSEKAVRANLDGVIETINVSAKLYGVSSEYSFMCFQEVDYDSTRSYYVDEHNFLRSTFSDYWSSFAQNYDSPYLIFPIGSAHGANKAGLTTLSKYKVNEAHRKELPVETGVMKYADLDRCLSINRIPVAYDQKSLVLINLHLTAYSSDGSIADQQLKMLLDICKKETEAGNYVICAGDFNKDLFGNASEIFGVDGSKYTWAQPFDESVLLGTGMELLVPDKNNEKKIPSCRNADAPYNDKQFVLTVDGFLVSSNVRADMCGVVDSLFKYSDHNPVYLKFTLK